ncbi:phage baseplate assembly protein V [Actinobacillus lignieresii]|uniref:Phage P2 baseplate assembly protein gpV n=1 Tax=Actinobacillus lignieresii TaxID=720 RepID=A0A380TUV6_ACTLI|nr:phage baseplate assembly protein V [Actinobacillus lignieresii]SUT91542.1 Phage P2 baseplate assembly protein gpV [Actinobacillus lignieresii]
MRQNTANTAEQERLLANIVRLGTIAEVDYNKALARVASGGITTDWLPWITPRAGKTKIWNPPTKGEQVLILAVGGDFTTAVILPGLFTQNAPSQSSNDFVIVFPDGATVKYNHESGHFSLTNCKTAEVQAENKITLKCPEIEITGNLKIGGDVQLAGKLNVDKTIGAKQGISSSGGDVSAGSISLKNHKHQAQGDRALTTEAKA